MKRYPLAELVRASGLTESQLSKKIGLSGSTLKYARQHGLKENAADRYAVRAGLTPWLVWSDWLEDLEVECASATCAARFVPSQSNNRYCSHQCAKNEWARKRYATDEAWRAKCLEERAAYYEVSASAQRRKAKAYYWANREAVRARQAAYYRSTRAESVA